MLANPDACSAESGAHRPQPGAVVATLGLSYRVSIIVDNDATILWNGTQIGAFTNEECANTQDRVQSVTVPDSIVQAGSNLLEVDAVDRGGESYFDGSVLSVGP